LVRPDGAGLGRIYAARVALGRASPLSCGRLLGW